jgi:hypothetical protein
MADPLAGLRKATSIGPARQTIDKAPVTQSIMPMPELGGLGGALGDAGEWIAQRLGMRAPEALQGLSRGITDVIHPSGGVPQVAPTGEDVDALTGLLKYNLAKVPKSDAKLASDYAAGASKYAGVRNIIPSGQPPLGTINPEFTPTGGERMYNAARGLKSALVDHVEAAYNNIRGRMGR